MEVVIKVIIGFIGFGVALFFSSMIIGQGILEEHNKAEERKKTYDNDEYDYGHNVDHYHIDGEGEL